MIISPVHRQERIPEKERLSLPLLKTTLEKAGKQVFCPGANSEIPGLLATALREGDVLVLLTNGSLGGISETAGGGHSLNDCRIRSKRPEILRNISNSSGAKCFPRSSFMVLSEAW